MDKDRILEILRQHEPELKAAGIAHLRLFGSVARGDAKAESDVDLLAELDASKPMDLFAVVHLQNRMSDLLETQVHLSLSNSLRPQILQHIEREALAAY